MALSFRDVSRSIEPDLAEFNRVTARNAWPLHACCERPDEPAAPCFQPENIGRFIGASYLKGSLSPVSSGSTQTKSAGPAKATLTTLTMAQQWALRWKTHEGHHLARCARIARSAHRMARHNDRPDPVRDLISMGLRSDSYAKSSSTPRSVRVKCRNGMVAHVENANWSAVDAHQLRSRRRAINRTQKRLSRARALIQTCASEGGRQYTTMSRAIKVG